MKNNKESSSAPKELLNELQSLAAEAEGVATGDPSGRSAEYLDHLRERFAAAQESLSEFYEDARKKILVGARTTDTAIRENPYPSMAIALCLGLGLGVLLSRRTK